MKDLAGHNGAGQQNKSIRSRTQSSDKLAEAEIEDQDKEFIQEYEEI